MKALTPSRIWDDLRPRIVALIEERAGVRSTSTASSGGGVTAHDLGGALHLGTLADAQATQFLKTDGSRTLTGNLAVNTGVTVDGVDISAHAVDPDAHHARAHSLISTSDHTLSGAAVGNVLQATGATTFTMAALDHQYVINPLPDQHHARDHLLVGSTHTASGLTTGHVVRASGATTFAWAQLQHSDLGGVTSDQHHAKLHNMLDTAHHSYTGGAALDVFGLSAANTLAKLTPSSAPGAASAILRSDSSGYLTLVRLTTTDRVRTPLIGTASGSLTLQPTTDLVLDPDSNLTKFADSTAIQTNSFTSGFAGAGLRIDQGVSRASKTTIETDDIFVRGRMHVYELLIHQIRATNGSVFVSSTGKATAVTSEGGSNYRIDVDPETMHGFSAGDVIRAQRFTGSGVYQCDMVVNAPVLSSSYFSAGLVSGTPAAGMEFVRIGSTSDTSRQGSLYLTADDSGAPFIDVVDGIVSHADWNTAGKVKVRLGKLTGITGTANEYGLLARNGTGNDSGYLKASTAGFELRNADFKIFNSSGNNQGKWTYTGIEFPLLTSAFKTISWTLAADTESVAAVRGAALPGEMHLDLLGSLGSSRTDGYVQMDMNGFDSGPVLGETSYVRAGVRRVSSTARSYTALMSSQKNFILGPATVISADTSNVTDPTATRNGLYLTNQYGAFASANNSEISNDTSAYQALMLIGNTDAGATRRVAIYDNLSIAGAAYNESALNVAGTAEINGGTSRPLRLTTSSGGPFALELYRSDLTNSVQMYNAGGYFYLDSPLRVVYTAGTDINALRVSSAGNSGNVQGKTYIGLHHWTGGTHPSARIGVEEDGVASYDASLVFQTRNSGSDVAPTTRMTITKVGNVGIGYTTPTTKLHVAGTLIVDGDEGGVANTIGFTDISQGVSTGTGTVKMGLNFNRDSTHWIKIYVGTTAVYIPGWSNIS